MRIICRPRYFSVLVVVSCLSAFSSPARSDSPVLIKLANYRFDPLISSPPLNQKQKIESYPETGRGYYILQFEGPVQEEWKEACRKQGVEFLDYLPDFAFIVRIPVKNKAEVETLPHLRWLGIYQPAYRIEEGLYPPRWALQTGSLPEGEEESKEIIVVLFPGVDAKNVISSIESRGGEVKRRTETPRKTKLRIVLSPDQIDSIARLSGVKWIEKAPVWTLYNDKAREIIRAETAWTAGETHSFYGSGQVVGVADTGLDRGSRNPADLLADFWAPGGSTSRVLAISTTWSSGTGADTHGHGTHVAGTILGNGDLSGADPSTQFYPSTCYAGVAPEASLVFQALGDLSGIPDDLNILFAQAYGGGARIHSNSWGTAYKVGGEYTSYSEDVDEYSWSNQDFLIVFSAGNSGVDANFDGVIDLYSLGSPATAKNCIAVGATENDRPPGSNPAPACDLTYGWYWPWDYPAEPISDSYVSDNPDGMAAFSSRGAQLAARYKPELVAPGTNIISTRTQAVSVSEGILWGSGGLTGTLKDNYVFSGGTSMSAPIVSGSAALVRQYYTDAAGITPSAALIKATLINGARDISPGQYGTGSTQEIPDPPRPNNVEGWGRVDLASTVFGDHPLDFYYFDVSPGFYTGQTREYNIDVTPSILPLSVTLAWTDHPGSTPASGALVNDLDLTVTEPGGTVHYPNNALKAGPIAYDEGMDYITYYYIAAEGMMEAVRFTPSCYPATITRGMFCLVSTTGSYSKTFEYRIYSGGAGGPVSLLASGTSTLRRPGWHSIDLSRHGVTINSGDFYLAIVMPDDDLGWGVDLEEPVAGRSWEYSSMTGWYKWLVCDYMFRAVISCPTNADRTNNVVGVDIEYPVSGEYTVRVKGYNVPYGPQPYALVVSRPEWGVPLPEKLVLDSGDYNGDGSSDIAVFRRSTGLWAIRGISRCYYGGDGDIPAPGDYDGDGTTEVTVFRPEKGLWAVRTVSRIYFGSEGDLPVPADYDGDGCADIAIFRENSGLWGIRNLTRFYFGALGDLPVPGDYDSLSPGKDEVAVFRPTTGLWALRDLWQIYFGSSGDIPVPARYDGLPGCDIATFRPSTGEWAIYAYTRYYYGRKGDKLTPADYDGDGSDETAVFRDANGLWSVRGTTRVYYGTVSDIPVTK